MLRKSQRRPALGPNSCSSVKKMSVDRPERPVRAMELLNLILHTRKLWGSDFTNETICILQAFLKAILCSISLQLCERASNGTLSSLNLFYQHLSLKRAKGQACSGNDAWNLQWLHMSSPSTPNEPKSCNERCIEMDRHGLESVRAL